MTNNGPAPIEGNTMDRISKRRRLICGISERKQGFAEYDSTSGEWSGPDIDYCRALSASLFFGLVDDTALTFVEVGAGNGYRLLANETIDVLCGVAINLVSDVLEPTSGEGFSFSTPYYYDNERYAQLNRGSSLASTRDDLTNCSISQCPYVRA